MWQTQWHISLVSSPASVTLDWGFVMWIICDLQAKYHSVIKSHIMLQFLAWVKLWNKNHWAEERLPSLFLSVFLIWQTAFLVSHDSIWGYCGVVWEDRWRDGSVCDSVYWREACVCEECSVTDECVRVSETCACVRQGGVPPLAKKEGDEVCKPWRRREDFHTSVRAVTP